MDTTGQLEKTSSIRDLDITNAERLSYELLGVIIDVEEGNGFDNVCLRTIKRVREELQILHQLEEELKSIKNGDVVILPVNKEHAEAMSLIVSAYLGENNGLK